jgi:hypothetical protein
VIRPRPAQWASLRNERVWAVDTGSRLIMASSSGSRSPSGFGQ